MLIPVRMAIILKNLFKMPVPSADKDVVQLDLSYIDGRNAKWFNHLENNLAVSYKLKLTFTIQPPPPSY